MGGPLTVPINRDPFEILEEAGVGGMGVVYRARDRATGRILALKVLKSAVGEVTRFTLEAHLLKKLDHPSIVEYVHHGVAEDGRPYLAMEWLEGESLENELRVRPLTVRATLRVARAVADALAFAHAAGIVHRDLKPSNVFITTSGETKLLDFGIAKSADVDGLTSTGQALGTPGYMSPEQARGGEVDGRSDLFSLGCLIFRALGGRRPFEGSDLMAFVTKLALEDPPPLRQVAPSAPEALEELVAQLLAKQPEDRPASAEVVREALERISETTSERELAATEREPSVPTLGSAGVSAAGAAEIAPTQGGGTLRLSGTKRIGAGVEPTVRSPVPAGDRASAPNQRSTEPLAPMVPSSKTARLAPAPSRASSHGVSAASEGSAATGRSSHDSKPALRVGRGLLLGIIASLGLVATGLVVAQKVGRDGAQGAATASTPGTPSASGSVGTTSASPDGPLVRDSDRVALDRACREWSSLLALGQRADGAFAGYAHADPSGWDTAQQLYSLTEARRACSGVGPSPLAAGANALVKLRVDDGWIGPRRPTAPNFGDRRAETPAIAWGLMALSGVARETSDPALLKEVQRTRADLLHARVADGGFRYLARVPGTSTLYSTMLATWALLETSPRGEPLGIETKEALGWLRREVLASSEAIRTQGVTEQVAWLLARAERYEKDPAPIVRDALRAAGAEIVAHCRLEKSTCKRPTYDTGKIPLNEGSGKLVTLWHPWATVSAYEITRDPPVDLGLGEGTLQGLRHITRWGNGELGGAITSLATAPEYKLSEYLIVVAKTLEPR